MNKKTLQNRAAQIFLFALCITISLNSQAESLAEWTSAIKSLCMSPDQPGKVWNVDTHANVKGDVNVKLVGNIEGDTGVTFSKGEWEGIQQVLKEQQAAENKNYRECIQDIIPKLTNKLSIKPEHEPAKLLALPLGTNRSNVAHDGEWISENGKVYFKSKQKFMGFEFDTYTKFINNQATEAFLKIDKEHKTNFNSSRYDPYGKSTESGNSDTVEKHCYGAQYNKIISNLIESLGPPTLPTEESTEDKSADLSYSGGNCTYRSAICDKKWTKEYRTETFRNIDTSIEFKATHEYISRSQTLGDTTSDMTLEKCHWLVKISET